tara:strand:- start:50 stop:724 length:675 start_codon:yes stop_codon:yes gene_type:complete
MECQEAFPRTSEFFHRHKGRSDGLVERCKTCLNETKKSYYEDNKDECKERMKDYYHNNKDKARSYWRTDKGKAIKSKYDKEYRKNNKEAIKAYKDKYQQENREELREKKKEYYQNNKEKIVEYAKKNRVKIRKNKRASNAKRHAQKLGQTTPDADLQLISKIYRDCPDRYHVDHMIPLSRNGLHHQDNLCYLPAKINCSKGSKTPEEFGIDEFNKFVIYWQDAL